VKDCAAISPDERIFFGKALFSKEAIICFSIVLFEKLFSTP
jgi:hypothetical protein